MKKFLMLSMLVCGAVSGAWGGTCTPMLCNEAEYDVTEMLTMSGVTGGNNNNDDSRFTSQNCFMCDTGGDSECNYGDTVAIVDNWGNVKSAWQCTDTGGVDDDWLSFSMDTAAICGDSPLGNMNSNLQNAKNVQVREGEATRGTVSIVINNSRRVSTLCKYRECKDGYEASSDGQSCVAVGNGGAVTTVKCDGKYNVGDRLPLDLEQCKKDYSFQKSAAHITKCEKECNKNGGWTHLITECEVGWELDTTVTQSICVEKEKQNNTNPGPSAFEKCLASRTTDEGKACCHLPNAVATWDGQHCNCVGGLDFKIENGRGQCSAKQQDSTKPFKCDAGVLTMLDGWIVSCKDKPTIIATINQIKTLCASDTVTADGFNVLWTALLALNPGECGVQQQLPQPPKPDDDSGKLRASLRIITDAHGTLNGISNGFKASVWKDEEGNFNTARLVSDSVAGVVLGTTGALVTSHVVKKNQVESGFEDIKCTIGGQVVADWGDQFRVGIQ